MSPLAAILLVCTHGDREVAADVYAASVQAGVDPAMALSVACLESGLSAKSQNPMGVRACYWRMADRNAIDAHRPPIDECIRIGVRSLANRLRGCRGDERCAISAYNNSSHKEAYAKRVLRIMRFLRSRLTTLTDKPTLR